MDFRKYQIVQLLAVVIILAAAAIIGCSKSSNNTDAPYAINNSLTLFKTDSTDMLSTDTVSSISGLDGKYISISGNTGATNGLGKIAFQLFTTQDSLLVSQDITTFFRPYYHVFDDVRLVIPKEARGEVYKIVVTSYDKDNNEIGKKIFYAIDVLTCDPTPECSVANQITIMLETPETTPVDDPIYIYGSINGWGSYSESQYMFHKNPDMANCYCLSIAYAPGYSDWQLTQIFVSRGSWETQAVTESNADTYWDYTTTAKGQIWTIKVLKWRDK